MKFFVLNRVVGSPYETRALSMPPENIGDCEYCPLCNRPASALHWLPPYHAEVKAFARGLGDVAFGSGDSLLVSDRFRKAWEDAKLHGIKEFAPLERIRVRPARLGRKPATYFHITVRLYGTRIDANKSHVKFDHPMSCDQCKGSSIDGVNGFAIDESSWTGEDIFYAWGMPGSMIATDRFRKLRDDYELTNINLTPVEQYVWDPYRRWTPFGMTDDD